MLRSTRLVGLVNTMDPKLVAAAFGMNPEGAMIYLADHIDDTRLDKINPDQETLTLRPILTRPFFITRFA
jgi:hypothetical protein